MVRVRITKNKKMGRVRQYYFRIVADGAGWKLTAYTYDLSKRAAERRFRKGNALFRRNVRAQGLSPSDFAVTTTRINKGEN